MSTLRQGQASRRGGKGAPPKEAKVPAAACLGRRGIPAGLSPCVKRYHETASRGAPYAAPAKLSLLFRERFLREAFTFFCIKAGFRLEKRGKKLMNEKKMTRVGLPLALSLALTLTACGGGDTTQSAAPSVPAESAAPSQSAAVPSGVEDGVLTVAMECSYPPYNWSQPDDSNGAVPIKDSNEFANGYDVMTAKEICEANGWELEIVRLAWDGLIPAVQSGTVDAIIAGQSMTAERAEQIDFAGPYLYATIVAVTKSDSAYANAKSVADLSGARCTSQSGTIWYTTCLPQIPDAQIQSPADTAPTMLLALETGTVDVVVTDMPTAKGALKTYSDMTVLNFSGTDGDFQFADETERAENVNIGISIRKGNTVLKEAMDAVLGGKTAEDFDKLMEKAVELQELAAQ